MAAAQTSGEGHHPLPAVACASRYESTDAIRGCTARQFVRRPTSYDQVRVTSATKLTMRSAARRFGSRSGL
jgi:hypothetical protein